jgi:hypothetical protein
VFAHEAIHGRPALPVTPVAGDFQRRKMFGDLAQKDGAAALDPTGLVALRRGRLSWPENVQVAQSTDLIFEAAGRAAAQASCLGQRRGHRKGPEYPEAVTGRRAGC